MSKGIVKQFYSTTAWIELRRNLIIDNKMTCDKCKEVFLDTSKLIGHHIKELTQDNINDTNITLNKENIEIICHECHNKEHRRFGYNKKKVYIVYGPPLSYTREVVYETSKYGDLIVDIDSLFQAVSGQPLYDKPDNIRFNVFRIRDNIIDQIKTRYGKWCDAYIVGGYANKGDRERLQKELNAELIFCNMTKEECYARVTETGKGKDWYGYIDKWFEEYKE
ncbi:MAG: HNH endonuclease signature motif containing protein [Clostridium sp.]